MDVLCGRSEQIGALFQTESCWTIRGLAEQLDCAVVSVRRWLVTVGYYSSFTHNGMWYTLREIPRFNRDGLWFHRTVGFSRQGTLSATLVHLGSHSAAGMSAEELGRKLQGRCHGVLAALHREGKLRRERRGGHYVYLAAEAGRHRQQCEELRRREASPKGLPAEIAVLLLAAFIKEPRASVEDLARGVQERSAVRVSARQVQELFELHGVKKTPRTRRRRLGKR